jgi:hypothetical protein
VFTPQHLRGAACTWGKVWNSPKPPLILIPALRLGSLKTTLSFEYARKALRTQKSHPSHSFMTMEGSRLKSTEVGGVGA